MTTRDPRTGRFVSTANVPESREGSFETYDQIPVDFQGADPADLTYDIMPRPVQADELAQGGSRFPPHPRHPMLVSMDEEARTTYGVQGALLRDAARLRGISGMIGHVLGIDDSAGPSQGVQEADDMPGVQPDARGDLRLAMRGQGRQRDR